MVYQPPNSSAPYREFDLSFCWMSVVDTPESRPTLDAEVGDFDPDWILMASWNFPHYMRIAKRMKARGKFVLSGMDNQWRGSGKQWLGVISARWNLKPAITTFLVAGDRQAQFARRLGYDDVLYGLYAADITKFADLHDTVTREQSFLFAGRLAPEKGIVQLLDAYRRYRIQSKNPWRLTVAGVGPLLELVRAEPGVDWIGFVDPKDLPALFRRAGCFILPSVWEPWGVVIHEAAAAGLPIVATYPCGATTTFVRDGVNGYVVSPRAVALTKAMHSISAATNEERSRMSLYSEKLAELWSPRLQAAYVSRMVASRLTG